MNDQLRAAMDNADLAEMDAIAQEIGVAAAQRALAVRPPAPRDEEAGREEKQKAEAEAQRQRDLDAALADVVELVARHRARLGRKTCSQHDGGVIRKAYDLLRNLHPGGEEL